MNFEPEFIVEDKYWAFGTFAKKDGTIDYAQLKQDLETLGTCIAAISLETEDGEYFARLSQRIGYKWIFENSKDINDDPSEHFEDFISGSVFEKFAEHAPEIIKRGFDTLATTLETSPDEFKANGINLGRIKNLTSISASIIKKVDNAFAHPILK